MKSFLVAILLIGMAPLVSAAPDTKGSGVILLSEVGIKPLSVPLDNPSPVYSNWSGNGYVGMLRSPQSISVEALAPNGMLRVRGVTTQGSVQAWLSPNHLKALPESFAVNVRKTVERSKTVEEFIKRKQIALGMTPDEVLKSVGKPRKKTQSTTREGVVQTWEYAKYKNVYQSVPMPGYGRPPGPPPPGMPPGPCPPPPPGSPFFGGVYVKVPVGTLTVKFQDGIVESIDQTEGNLENGEVSVVIPPINVYR